MGQRKKTAAQAEVIKNHSEEEKHRFIWSKILGSVLT